MINKIKIKKSIKILSILGLTIITGSVLIYTIFKNTNQSLAAYLPNESPLSEINFNSNAKNIRVDMDSEGNQYYVWRTAELKYITFCNSINYQVYNKSGLPITKATTIANDCNSIIGGSGEATGFYTPDIIATENNFYIIYTKIYPQQNFEYIHLVKFTNYTETDSITIYSNLNINKNSRPRMAISSDQKKIGITFQTCHDQSCNSYDTYFQGISDYSNLELSHDTPKKINFISTNNLQNPNIAFSGDRFMITYQSSNNIYARAITHDALILLEHLTVASNTASEPDITGALNNISSTTNSYFGTFYITYKNTLADAKQEILIQRIHCDFNHVIPNSHCSRRQPIVRASTSDNIPKLSPQITIFKNTNNINRKDKFINYLTVAWQEGTISEKGKIKAKNYTNVLETTGSTITVAEQLENMQEELAISSNIDGHFTVAYRDDTNTWAKLFPTKFLKLSNEKILHAPDTRPQERPKVAKNSNGNYVVAYQNYNGNDYDIIFGIYDHTGNPIKNLTIANSTTTEDQIKPVVKYFNEPENSINYGKFIIAWEGGIGNESNIYYRIFNADGTPETGDISINQNPGYIFQSEPDISAGHYGQFGITYIEHEASTQKTQLYYHNENNNIYQTLYTLSTEGELSLPKIAISPEADGSTGNNGKSKFFATWWKQKDIYYGYGYITSGYLNSPTSITQNATQEDDDYKTMDIQGAYNIANNSFTPPMDPFYFVRINSYIEAGKMNIGFYNSDYQYEQYINMCYYDNSSISIDPVTQNILIACLTYAEFEPNYKQVLFFPANQPNTLTNGQIYDKYLTKQATITSGYEKYMFISDTNPTNFHANETIGTVNVYNATSKQAIVTLKFDHNISTHFSIGQNIKKPGKFVFNPPLATGRVTAVGEYNISVIVDSGSFGSSGSLTNSPYYDEYTSTENGMAFYFSNGESLNFEVGNTISNSNLENHGYIKYVYNNSITVIEYDPQNGIYLQNILDFNKTNDITNDYPIYVAGQFLRFIVNQETNKPEWVAVGPPFAISEKMDYGQSFEFTDVSYDTRNQDHDKKSAIVVYSSSGESSLPDANGVYVQLIDDPFTLGSPKNLETTAEQQITPGGKYIIVPQTIDFGVVNKNNYSTVNLADLTPSCVEITDLDGSEFDLTVSLTNLQHTTIPGATITNDNFIIENQDDINPPITALTPFTSVSDVTLSPSTNPGTNANLGTTQTLMIKNNPNTGSWKICPKAKLNIPADTDSGVYSGTLTFTLI